MPDWGQICQNLRNSSIDDMRRKYLAIMERYTGRNIISYYSAFLQKPNSDASINDNDKNAFMQVVHGLDRSQGLDLILHTPGGDITATESIVYYLKKLFDNDIRVFIPQIAMSAGTMIALASIEIVMGKQSNLGPIDPQYRGVSCAALIEEFDTACQDILQNPHKTVLWSQIIAQYPPTFIVECNKGIALAEGMVKKWLMDNMFSGESNKAKKATKVLGVLSSHVKTFTHSRHIHSDELKKLGLKVTDLESLNKTAIDDCNDLQDCVLSIHHTYMQTFQMTKAVKIIENHKGRGMIINQP